MEEKPYKPKKRRFDNMPEDVYRIVIDAQSTKKQECNCQFSIEQTVYMLIRKAAKPNEK